VEITLIETRVTAFSLPVVEVLLPLPLSGAFTYILPEGMIAQVGIRVLVPFGKGKLQAGVVRRVATIQDKLQARELKFVKEVLDEVPVVTPTLLDLYDWIADYYLCKQGEVLKASLPTGLKMQSTRTVYLPEGLDPNNVVSNDKEALILDALAFRESLSEEEAQRILMPTPAGPLLQRMAEKGLIYLVTDTQASYKPKVIRCLAFAPLYRTHEGLQQAFDLVKRAPKQENALMLVAQFLSQHGGKLPLRELHGHDELSHSALKALRDKGILQTEFVTVDRVPQEAERAERREINLTPAQTAAYAEIAEEAHQEKPRPILLHGVTGSGKTHLYIEFIRSLMGEGKQVLYLLPEIGLTRQIIDRVREAFGNQVGVYHSRFSPAERVEIWQKVLKGEHQVVIGVRSAILLPFPNLVGIVIDEEHDTSFKQQEPNPRYNARDVAIWLGYHHQIPVLLGSATPALESFENAQSGKYKLVSLRERAQQAALPTLQMVDMRLEAKEKRSHGQFSEALLTALQEVLDRGEQAILFKNRRGYAPIVVCNTCGHVPKCTRCDISLTYHKHSNRLRCHYCGYSEADTTHCSVCNTQGLRHEGIGTERLEEQLQDLFPTARIARMDQDTTRGKYGFARIIAQLEAGELDFLVGTQMVTKGLDFERVTLAAVLHTDSMIGYPDFRAHEYAYAMLTQFAGRAGRSSLPGNVILQTRQPEHPILQLLTKPYGAFYQQEVVLREAAKYPPYVRLVSLTLLHKDHVQLETEGQRLAAHLKARFGDMLLGPEYPPIARLKDLYRLGMLLKLPRTLSLGKAKAELRTGILDYYKHAPNKTLRIDIDVDPR
jgi:primosomal protein N' (replication factor Y) (superfamily II helicase)